jgi:hypothetical protein
MSFDGFGAIFNCGFSRTFVYEYCSATNEGKGRGKKKKKPAEVVSGSDHRMEVESQVPCSSGSKDSAEQIPNKVRLDLTESFKCRFDGPPFSLGDNYFQSLNK